MARVDGVRLCIDRVLPLPHKVLAAKLAIEENRRNDPQVPKTLPGVSVYPLKLALFTGKMWQNARTLSVRFLDGSPTQRTRVQQHAEEWCSYANIKFNFNGGAASEVRISFIADRGSWSAVGTDCLVTSYFRKGQPTMNFGWLKDGTDDVEYRRVVVHEFGHALGAIHEHQNPKGGIQWNLAAVYKYFAGPPNYWSKQDTDINVVMKYSVDQLNASVFDPDSIMLYHFDGALIKGGQPTKFNTKMSIGDKAFIKQQYP